MTLYTHPVSDSAVAQPVPLTYEQRLRCRLFLQLGSRPAHIILPRGMRLRSGLQIKADDGSVLRIESASEEVSIVKGQGLDLARACYHLGNRHIPAAIREDCVSYQKDGVIDDMMRGLGFEVMHGILPFEPESGAYAGHDHRSGESRH